MTALAEWREIALASLGLPDTKLLSVLALVESVPYCGQVGEVLDCIRPRLVRLRPPRPLTVQRLLFRPAEDLLDSPKTYRMGGGRLSRQILHPCWQILSQRDPDAVRAAEDDLGAVDLDDPGAIYEVGLSLWRSAAGVLAEFLKGEAGIGRLHFDGGAITVTRDMLVQLSLVTEVLVVAADIERVKLRLRERPIRALSEWDGVFFKRIMAELAAQSVDRVGAFATVVMARMSCPGQLLAVLSELSVRLDAAQRAELVKRLGRNAVGSVADEAGRLRQVAPSDITDPVGEARTAETMVVRLESLERHLDGLTRHAVKEQVATARREIGSFVLDKLVTAVDQTMAEKMGVLAAPAGPDAETDAFDHEKRLDDCALSLKRCAGIAHAVGIKRELDARLKTICAQLERAGTGFCADVDGGRRKLVLLVRLIELIAGPDEAQRVLLGHFGSVAELAGL